MKCPSCGYQKEVKKERVDEVVRFKSGPRKGEIKGVERREIELKIGHEDFAVIELLTGVRDSCGYNYYGDITRPLDISFSSIDVLICPDCGTLFVKPD